MKCPMAACGPAGSGGVALLSAMVVLALVAATTTAMVTRQQMDIHRTAALLHSDQAYLYAVGVEYWAAGVLVHDARLLGERTSRVIKTLPSTPVPGGSVAGSIVDAQARMDINALVPDGGPSRTAGTGEAQDRGIDETTAAEDLKRFRRLLGVLNLDAALADAIADWLDADREPRQPAGAEDEYYQRQTPPYRAANRRIVSASELLLVRGVTPDVYHRLRAFVSVLPAAAPINVNTAAREILMSLAEETVAGDIDDLIATREREPFKKITDFMAHEAFAGHPVSPQGLDVSSVYVHAYGQARVASAEVYISSLLHRVTDKRVDVLKRTQGWPDE
ncbi:MAG: type II secretion system minor pseudopilin GspK [Gammaproteobacteria bacterium]